MVRTEDISALSLAFLGDAVYSQIVREYLVRDKDWPVKALTAKTIHFVSAKAQAARMRELLAQGLLDDEELAVYRRGRNAHSRSQAKNADPVTYRVATGFESLIGYLYLQGRQERLGQIWDFIRTRTGE